MSCRECATRYRTEYVPFPQIGECPKCDEENGVGANRHLHQYSNRELRYYWDAVEMGSTISMITVSAYHDADYHF